MSSRFLHLVDSQVVLGAVTKGRSSSRHLGRVVDRLNALILAANARKLLAFVWSVWNPADDPSRRGSIFQLMGRRGKAPARAGRQDRRVARQDKGKLWDLVVAHYCLKQKVLNQ